MTIGKRVWDDGCEVSPSCFDCPLSVCKYDDPRRAFAELKVIRDRRVLDRLTSPVVTSPSVAEEFGVSIRTIQRIIARAKGQVAHGA